MPNPNADTFKFDFVTNGAPDCNWGELTAYGIHELDFDQGEHSSNPPDLSPDVPGRDGLPNLFGQGDLFAACEFVANEVGFDLG